MDTLIADLRHAARSLRRRPAFTTVAVLTLALGLGANTALFAVVNAVLLRPLPFPAPDRLMRLNELHDGNDAAVAPANYLDWRADSRTFDQIASYDVGARNLRADGTAERVVVARTSSNFFATMGTPPAAGRAFTSADAEGEPVAVLSWGLWQRDFGGAANVVGSPIDIDDTRYTVVGIMPVTFDFPAGSDLWTAAPHDVPGIGGFQGDITQMRDAWYFETVGRMKAGVTLAQARADMDRIAARLAETWPVSNARSGIRIEPLHDVLVGSVRPVLLLLTAAVALVLLIACANLANLMLIRAAGRGRELAIRTALGARRGALVRVLLSESALVAFAGCAAGILLATIGVRVLTRGLTDPALRAVGGTVSGTVLLFSIALATLTMVAFGAIPALVAARVEPGALTGTRGGDGSGRGGRRARSALVVAEMALAVLLVLGATLALRSVQRLGRVEPGFRSDGLTTLMVSVPGVHALSPDAVVRVYQSIVEQVRALPGIASVSLAMTGPMDDGPGAGLRIESQPRVEGTLPDASWQVVSEEYFQTAGIPLVRGRAFDERDGVGAVPVAVINETMARSHWPGSDPIGERINTGLDGDRSVWVSVIGVAADTKNEGVATAPSPEIYRPLVQPNRFRGEQMMMLVRGAAGPVDVAAVRNVIHAVRADVPVYSIRTGDELVNGFTREPRFLLTLLAAFALLALVLGAVGIYGVTAQAVGARTREIGVRLALGASPATVLIQILRGALQLAAVGLAIGLVAALALTRFMQAMLYETSTTDPASFIAVACVMLAVAMAATLIPARRAAGIDPLTALRAE